MCWGVRSINSRRLGIRFVLVRGIFRRLFVGGIDGVGSEGCADEGDDGRSVSDGLDEGEDERSAPSRRAPWFSATPSKLERNSQQREQYGWSEVSAITH